METPEAHVKKPMQDLELQAVDIVGAGEVQLLEIPPSTSRIPYNNGYGDFVFGRLIDGKKGNKGQTDFVTGSNAVPFVELNGFQRSGIFPFNDLPIEVRQAIIGMMIKPMFSYRGVQRTPYFEIKLSRKRFQPDLAHPDRQHGELHPESRPCRSLYAWSGVDRRDHLFVDWVRQISNTSNQFRKELGDVLWKTCAIEASGDQSDFHEIKYFLESRPAIHKGIRIVSFGINHRIDLNHREFEACCSSMALLPRLYKLEITLDISENDLHRLGQGLDGFVYLTASRNLQLLRVFHIRLDISMDYELVDDEDDDDEGSNGTGYDRDREEELQSKYLPIVEDLMLPAHLKSSRQPSGPTNQSSASS
ncbi:uncharacterized protein LY89DRAFT_732103 [Mollisia scopiformis]|uniref:Uncharacterized protein n=1 Tax=Mollisia scopiformis TaxID=149040 RepID=A0A194XEE1_MOLSC|nr:uncharacterized protein LY89DRAFT_732103 [Mollisia scopiformis]KUJ18543.1 hypothetical protein LY89DRAFT_732103 [Mollisia scopiformis]